jgi:subtilase family serine protease
VARGFDGRGQTIVLPEIAPAPGAAGVTDVRQDLARLDSVFSLPGARLRVITRFAAGASPYLAAGEEAGDAEIVHAIAPAAAIDVVLLPAALPRWPVARIGAAYAAALRTAPALGSVVSLSAGLGEQCFSAATTAVIHSALAYDQRRHVTVTVSSGDYGAAISPPCPGTTSPVPPKGVDYPASDPLVLAVGGTSLDANHHTGAYLGETVWNRPISPTAGPNWASGGGFSTRFPRPPYQAGRPGTGAGRGVPDVAADADAYTGIALVGVAATGQYAITPGAGTSAGAPFWAGLVAIANQYAHRDLGFINPGLYRIAKSASYRAAFHDVTTGDNTVRFGTVTVTGYHAAPGWDPVTGWGSPDAQVLVPLLAR